MKLEQFFSQTLINSLMGFVSVMDNNSTFIKVNGRQANILGHRKQEEIEGSSYDFCSCLEGDNANMFVQQDQRVIKEQSSMNYVSYHQYADKQWYLLLGEKSCFKNEEGEVIGLISQAQDITNIPLIDISRFMYEETANGRLKRKAFTYYCFNEDFEEKLSKKEMEVLFYLLRGKSAKEIATILFRSKRTIEFHFESLKHKFQASNRSGLIEKAILEGYMSVIPESLFV